MKKILILMFNLILTLFCDKMKMIIQKESEYFAEGFVKIISSENKDLLDKLVCSHPVSFPNEFCKNMGFKSEKFFQLKPISIKSKKIIRCRAKFIFNKDCCYLYVRKKKKI